MDKNSETEWRDIPGYENYKISEFGEVISYRQRNPKKLTPRKIKKYLAVSLANSKRVGTYDTSYIHRLVALTFLPKPEEDLNTVIHLDLNLNNNHWSNLEWIDQSTAMKYNHKKNPKRFNTPIELSEDQVFKDGIFPKLRRKNMYYKYEDTYRQIHDTGKALIIRVPKKNGGWSSKSLAKLILEKRVSKPFNDAIASFINWNYYDFRMNNLVWETGENRFKRLINDYPEKFQELREQNRKKKIKEIPDGIISVIKSYLNSGKSLLKAVKMVNNSTGLNFGYEHIRKKLKKINDISDFNE